MAGKKGELQNVEVWNRFAPTFPPCSHAEYGRGLHDYAQISTSTFGVQLSVVSCQLSALEVILKFEDLEV